MVQKKKLNRSLKKLSPKEIEATQQEVAKRIESDLLQSSELHPKVKDNLSQLLQDPTLISEENLYELKGKNQAK